MLDILLRNWLGNMARQRVYEAARQAASEHLAKAAEEPSEAARQPCDVGIVFSSALQSGAFEDRLDGVVSIEASGVKFVEGGLRGRRVVCVHADSAAAAEKATGLLIAGNSPRWVLSAGTASALDSQLARGDFLLASEVCDESSRRLAIDLRLPDGGQSSTPRVHSGRLISTERAIRSAEEKERLAAQHAAVAVDRTSFAVADVCRQEKTRFLAVRILGDAMQDELPKELQRVSRKKTRAARWGAALGAIVHRPSAVKDMLEVQERALSSADRLAKFLEGVIAQLPA